MRTPALISITSALLLAACGSHALTGDQTGTGGTGTGGLATGGFATGGFATGGVGGTGGRLQAFCSSLEDQYQRALGVAQLCDVGSTASCAQQANSSLRACGSCPTFVTDASALKTLQQSYDQAGCEKLVPPCYDGVCAPANNNVCVSIDGGSQASCSYVPGTTGAGGSSGTGGSSGGGGASGDAGVVSCSDLAAQYSAALAVAKSCDASVANACAQKVRASLSPCSTGCVDYVSDASQLTLIDRRWQALGCGNTTFACPAIACEQPAGSACLANATGGASCENLYLLAAPAR
ncbi:MAG TPA: hypothetical protein VN962_10555 [Polyangia bacterium]|nr:hypothetical protein [Polyangia bacterium]